MKKFESLGRSLSKGEQRKIRECEDESLDEEFFFVNTMA